MESLQTIVAKKLLQLRTVSVQIHNPIMWANGWKSPIYLDDRKILSYTYARNFIKLELGRLVAERYPDADVIAGIATTAIAHGVLVAEQLSLPFVYVHPSPKTHGLENQIEGDLRPRQKVVIIENQVSAGINANRVIEAIRNAGCTVLGVMTIFDYELPMAQKVFHDTDIELTALTTFSKVISLAKEEKQINEEDCHVLEQWHANPAKWHK